MMCGKMRKRLNTNGGKIVKLSKLCQHLRSWAKWVVLIKKQKQDFVRE